MRWTSLAGLLWLTASVGHAQSSVDAALQTADAHAQEGDHRAAIAVLETARAETPSARLDLSLAVNLAATGSLRDAATLLRALIDAGTNPLVAEVARERLAAIERRLPTLTVMFRDPPPPSSRLMIDGQLEARSPSTPACTSSRCTTRTGTCSRGPRARSERASGARWR